MSDPFDMSQRRLASIVAEIVDVLYLDVKADGTRAYNPDKEWDGDLWEAAADVLVRAHLVPTEYRKLER
mgnify:CR=1 FL=1